MKTYKSLVRCKNCKSEAWFDVPMGTFVKEHMLNEAVKCSGCECPYESNKGED